MPGGKPSVASTQPAAKQIKTLPSPITEISMQRNPGLTSKPSPMYAITLRSDGTALYVGAIETRHGTYKTTISPPEFEEIARLLTESGYFRNNPSHSAAPTAAPDDAAYLTISAVRNGKRRTEQDWGTINYGHLIPRGKEIIDRMDAFAEKADWTKISEKDTLPEYSWWRENYALWMSDQKKKKAP